MPTTESITVPFEGNTKSLERSIAEARIRMIELRATVLGTFKALPKTLGNLVVGGLRSLGSTILNILKKGALAAMLIFALSIQKIVGSIRDTIGELITLRGGQFAKDVDAVKGKFVELRATIAAAFLPLIELALPYIRIVLDWLIQLFNRIAMITAAFLGQKEVLQVVAGSAAELAENAKKTEKAARGALAAFDQINVLQQPKEDNTATVAAQMVPITDDILAKVQKIKDEIAAWWADPLGKIQEAWPKIVGWLKTNIFDPIAALWKSIWSRENLTAIGNTIFEVFTLIGNIINATFTAIGTAINNVFTSIGSVIDVVFTAIGTTVSNIFTTVGNIINDAAEAYIGFSDGLMQSLKGIIQYVKGIFTGDLETAWQGIVNFFSGTFNAFVAIIRGAVNIIIDVINGLLRAIEIGVNAIAAALNSISFTVPDWVPGFGGASFSLAIPAISIPQIPKLATGAVIPPNSQFLAVLGDQRSGTNIETPVELMKQTFEAALANAIQNQTITINFTGSLSELVRQLKPHIDKENSRVGGSLIQSTVTS